VSAAGPPHGARPESVFLRASVVQNDADLAPLGSVAEVAAAARALRGRVAERLARGDDAESVTASITAFNDAATRRLIAIVGAEDAFRGAGACWIALGSEGRDEQTLASDQDNALVFADGPDASATCARLVPLAARVNDALDACGLAYCRGDVMAARWCLPESAWRERFAAWLRTPDPAALLNAVVFFDFRPIAGATPVAARLRSWLAARTPDAGAFLGALARNALENGPPLGLFGRLVSARAGAERGTIDLKTNGVQPYVEAARVYALAGGSAATHTPERLRAAADGHRIAAADIAAWCAAFGTLQRMRLELNVRQIAAGQPPGNHLDPRTLDAAAQRSLRAALQATRGLQARLARDFGAAVPAFGA
jgi:CBS domain-containing protein